jgi:hypothetical protein
MNENYFKKFALPKADDDVVKDLIDDIANADLNACDSTDIDEVDPE